jgi:hypothetical protein
MKRFINFGSIGQFRETIKNVQTTIQFEGVDVDGNAIYNHAAKMPKVVAVGSEKLHGTNCCVCYNSVDGFWVQSRNNIITPESDNAGSAFAAVNNTEAWLNIIYTLANHNNIDLEKNTISIYYEWAGGNIQAKSALTGLDKRAVIFQHFKVSPIDINSEDTQNSYWLETSYTINNKVSWVSHNSYNIFNIMDFPTYLVEIDFNTPLLSQNEMIKLVKEIVEPASPVGKAFGKDKNIGEGIVFTFLLNNTLQRFKVKGEKHANSKVRTLKPVDDVKEQSKIDFANYAANSLRLEQAWQTVFGINNEKQEPSVKFTGDFLKAVVADVMKEELDVMTEKGLEPKDVNGAISAIARRWFQDELNKQI